MPTPKGKKSQTVYTAVLTFWYNTGIGQKATSTKSVLHFLPGRDIILVF